MKLPITTGAKKRPQKVAFYGTEGVGKTTIASQLPSPLFADCEGGTDHIDVSRVVIKTIAEFREVCLFLIREPHDFKSFVVDTIDWLAARDVEEMLAEDEKVSVEDYGFGKGYKKAEERFHVILSLLDRVGKAGINVVILAHSKILKFEEPDKGGTYDRYELKLEKKIAPLLKEWCDALIFMNFESRIVERDAKQDGGKKRAIGGKKRIFHCERAAAYDAKNRHGMPETCEATIANLKPILNFMGDDVKPEQKPEPKPEPKSRARVSDVASPPEARNGSREEADTRIDPTEASEAPVEALTIAEKFAEVIQSAGGAEVVKLFLASRNLNIGTVDESYMRRAIADSARFIQAVAAFKASAA